jgi:hypothetical protein
MYNLEKIFARNALFAFYSENIFEQEKARNE